jgi:hypothetical protein
MIIGVEVASSAANGAMNTIALYWREIIFLVQVRREGEEAFQAAQKSALA